MCCAIRCGILYVKTLVEQVAWYAAACQVLATVHHHAFANALLPEVYLFWMTQDYFMLYGRHQKETILNHMPEGFKDIAKQSAGSVRGDMIPVPDQDKHVFCRVLADRGYVEMNNSGYAEV